MQKALTLVFMYLMEYNAFALRTGMVYMIPHTFYDTTDSANPNRAVSMTNMSWSNETKWPWSSSLLEIHEAVNPTKIRLLNYHILETHSSAFWEIPNKWKYLNTFNLVMQYGGIIMPYGVKDLWRWPDSNFTTNADELNP